MSEVIASVGLSGSGDNLASNLASGVMAIMEVSFGVGVVLVLAAGLVARATALLALATALVGLAVGAKVSLVCFEPVELIPLVVDTRVCLDLSPPRGDASFPLVLVGFRLFFDFLVMVTRVASVRRWT